MQNAKPKNDLSERLLEYGAQVIRLSVRLSNTPVGRHISGQLIRAGTSAGANYEEARAAESRRDFVHKLQVVLKELREACYWLRLIRKSAVIPSADPHIATLFQETNELCNIFAKSVITAKERQHAS